MAADMASELATIRIPAAIALFGFGFESGAFAQMIEHTIRLELQEIVGIKILRVFERAAGETNVRKRERMGRGRDDGRDCRREGGGGEERNPKTQNPNSKKLPKINPQKSA